MVFLKSVWCTKVGSMASTWYSEECSCWFRLL